MKARSSKLGTEVETVPIVQITVEFSRLSKPKGGAARNVLERLS